MLTLSDLHTPHHDVRSLAAVEKLMAAFHFDIVVYLGDFMDFDCISHHNEHNERAREGKRILEDYKVAAEILDLHRKICGKQTEFVYIAGNHDHRIEKFIDSHKEFEGMFEIPTALQFARRNIKWVPFWETGEVYKVGKANFIHGRYTNQFHAKKTVQFYGRNIFYGHSHDVQCYSAEMYGTDSTIVGQSLGCLCLPQDYMAGRPDKWQQAVGIFEFLPDGTFGYNVERIIKHRLIHNGKIYEG